MDKIKSEMAECGESDSDIMRCVIKEEMVFHCCFLRYKGHGEGKERKWFMLGLLFIFMKFYRH